MIRHAFIPLLKLSESSFFKKPWGVQHPDPEDGEKGCLSSRSESARF
jgi:hypothetical protein